MMLPGRTVLVALIDNTELGGITAFSWRGLRLRHARVAAGELQGIVIVPPASIVTIQLLPKGT